MTDWPGVNQFGGTPLSRRTKLLNAVGYWLYVVVMMGVLAFAWWYPLSRLR